MNRLPTVPPPPMLTAAPTSTFDAARHRRRRPLPGRRISVIPIAIAAVLLGGGGTAVSSLTTSNGHGGGPPPAGNPPGTVQQWITTADQVLVANGTPPGALNDADVWIIIQHESSGNPHSINTTDINAQHGNPSEGLMQTTLTTFAAHEVPGHGDIWAPVDNIVAGVRYAIGRYGSLENVPGVRAIHAGSAYVPY